jgi:hypothetical protein
MERAICHTEGINNMENDLISRQAAIDALDCISGVEEVLRSLPSAQPEIIRCKDCRWYGFYSCKLYGNDWMRDGNGYCDRAERRTE